MLAKDVMTSDVIAVKPDTSVEELAKILLDNKISGVPVVNEHYGLMGIVSEADLIVRDSKLHIPAFLNILGSIIYLEDPDNLKEEVKKTMATKVRDLMTDEVVSVNEDASLEDVATLMVDKKINRVPVVRNGILVGIISRGDIVRSLVK